MLAGSIGYIVSLGGAAWAFYAYGAAFTAAMKAIDAQPRNSRRRGRGGGHRRYRGPGEPDRCSWWRTPSARAP